ncbi:hypothetical protein M422DRAFT_243979 [Sphaerobolus stellatus SS14]|nr:hypothetical protein M422DRAFT_243979 [Sphaerobolus stellatus SS14]
MSEESERWGYSARHAAEMRVNREFKIRVALNSKDTRRVDSHVGKAQSNSRTSLVKRQSGFTWPLPLSAILLTTTVIGSTDVILSTTLLTTTLSTPTKTETVTSTHSTALVTSSIVIQTTHIITFTTSQTTHTVTLPTTSVTSTTAIVDSMSRLPRLRQRQRTHRNKSVTHT